MTFFILSGCTYSFRLVSYSPNSTTPDSEPSLPSPPLTIPLVDVPGLPEKSANRQKPKPSENGIVNNYSNSTTPTSNVKTNFEEEYIELEELGRGRFSVVRRCQELLTGREVAVKFLNRRRQSQDQARREHGLLARIRHSNIVGAGALFSTTTSDAIVIDL